MSQEQKTCSIALRIRRVIHEDAYVAVPVTDAIMKQKNNGSLGIDFDAFVAEALRISQDLRVSWTTESIHSEPHPVQGPVPEGRASFDPLAAAT